MNRTTTRKVVRNDYQHNTVAAAKLLGISRQRVQRLINLGKLDAINVSDFGFSDNRHYAKWLISASSIQERIEALEEWKILQSKIRSWRESSNSKTERLEVAV